MPKPVSEISTYVLECLEGEPVRKRIRLTRALAKISLPPDREELTSIADELESCQNRTKQLRLNFKRRAEA